MDELKLSHFERHYIVEESGCWIWVGAVNRSGYGVFYLNGKKVQAHRAAYEHYVGPIPDGHVLDHKCLVKPCVNPEHLEPVTSGENTRRGRKTMRCPHCNELLYPDKLLESS